MNKKEAINAINAIKEMLQASSKAGLTLDAENWIDKREYSDEDLFHILNLFMHIVWNIQASKLIAEWGSSDEATKMWEALKELIKTYLDIDTVELTKKILDKE